MSAKRGRTPHQPRPHTLLENIASNPQAYQNRRDDIAARSADGSLKLGLITVVQADHSLRQFPQELREQLDEYLKTPGATARTFAHNTAHFNLFKTTDGRSASFVEMGTTEVMDAAYYQCGPIQSKGMIVVVKPQSGSTFNDGNAAIISFYGKGNARDGRNVISRWSIWTPSGMNRDILVDGMITDDASESDQSIVGSARKRKKQRIRHSLEPLQCAQQDSDDTDGGDKAVRAADESDGEAAVATNKTLIKTEAGNNESSLSNNRDVPVQQLLVDPSTTTQSRQQASHLHAQRSVNNVPLNTPNSRLHQPNPSSTTWSAQRHTPYNSPHVRSPDRFAGNTAFVFKASPNGEIELFKTLAQCNSVYKLFAYARKAGLTVATTVVLTTSVGEFSVDVIKDDVEDFDELLRAVGEERSKVGEEAIVEIAVVSADY